MREDVRKSMKIWRSVSDIDIPKDTSTVATIGTFDGMHQGHQYLLNNIIDHANAHSDLMSVVVTFDPHPVQIHQPEIEFEAISSLDQRLELLESQGIDAALVLDYSLEFAQTKPEDFVQEIFLNALSSTEILLGYDTAFGVNNSGGISTLEQLQEEKLKAVDSHQQVQDVFKYQEIDDLQYNEHDRQALKDLYAVLSADQKIYLKGLFKDLGRYCSSTIRDLITTGNVHMAVSHLNRPHTVRGTVVHGFARGRELGFPTANLGEDIEGLIPGDGVYAGWMSHETPNHGKHKHPAAISIGTNPTFDGVSKRTVEAYVMDRPNDENVEDFNLYNQKVDIDFVTKIRDMTAYDGTETLIKQMYHDIEAAEKALDKDQNNSGSVNIPHFKC